MVKKIKSINSNHLNLNEKRILFFLISIILSLLFISIVVVLFTRNSSPVNDNSSQVITYSGDTPDESMPDENYQWMGEGIDPKKIQIPQLDLDGFIVKVGRDQKNEIAVPENIHTAGWFVDSVRPSEKGLSIIDGHVDGVTQPGIFNRLNELTVNDEFFIETGEGKILKYRVIDLVTDTIKNSHKVLFSKRPEIKSQLNLVTCTGTYLTEQKTYDNRLILISELVE